MFGRITGQESTTTFPQYVLYFLHGTFKMDLKFDWAQVISSEISHQLSSYQETERFFMATYLVYVVIYNCFVNELSVKKDLDVTVEPIQFWYPTLWKLLLALNHYLLNPYRLCTQWRDHWAMPIDLIE